MYVRSESSRIAFKCNFKTDEIRNFSENSRFKILTFYYFIIIYLEGWKERTYRQMANVVRVRR